MQQRHEAEANLEDSPCFKSMVGDKLPYELAALLAAQKILLDDKWIVAVAPGLRDSYSMLIDDMRAAAA